MSVAIPANTSIIVIDTRLVSKTITLPSVTLNPGRILFLKDYYGTTVQSTLTITVQGSDLIDDYNTSYIFSNNFGTVTFISDGVTSWRTTGFYDGGLSYVTNIASFIPPAAAITLSLSSLTSGTVTITPSNYAASYMYYINTSTSIVSPIYSAKTTVYGSPVSFTTTLRIGILYYAIVVPYNAVGGPGPQAASTSAYLAITPGTASIALTLNSPTSGSVIITPDINAETYNYYISTDTTIGNAIYSGTTAIVNTPISFSVSLTGNVPYYAIVVAVNPYTSGPQFVSSSAIIYSPTAVTVTFSSATFNSASFTITAGLYATSYTYYLTTSSSSIVSPLFTGTTTQAGPVNFAFTYPSSTTYYIIVIPYNSFGAGPQAASNGIAFTIVLPSAPTVTFNSLTSTGGQFTASFVNYANYYTYYISTTTSPANAVYTNTTTLNNLTVNFTLVTPLLTNTNYYVLVVPVNGNGSGSQGTSSPLSFTLPSGGSATFTSVTYQGGNIQIAAATNGTFYNYYLSTTTSIANSIYSWTTTLTGVAIPIYITLQGSTTYYAIVIPYNTYGQGPQFTSSAVSFTLPSGGSVVFSSYTTTGGSLTITASTNATLYTYYISPNTTIASAFYSDTTTTTGSAVTFATLLQGSTTYYMIVVPSNSYGPGPYLTSPPISFTLPTGGSVTLLSLTSTGGTLQIVAATNATSYAYYISTALSTQWATFSSTTTTTGSTVTFSGASFASGLTYYAIVVPTNAYGPGLQVVSNSNSINLPSGGAVTLSGLSYTGGTILISAATNATSYRYYISFSQNIVDAVYTDTTVISGSPVTFATTLLVNEPYYAIIIPINSYGQGLNVVSLNASFNLPSPTTVIFSTITSSGGTIIIAPSLNATSYTYYISPTTSPTNAIYTGTTTTTDSAIAFTIVLISQQVYYALVIPTNIFGSAPETASNGTYFILPFGGYVAPPNLTTTGGNITITASSYATYYMYYISLDTTIANAVYSNTTTVTGSVITFSNTFQGSTMYYAIVVPYNAAGVGSQFNSSSVTFILPYGGSVTTSTLTPTGGNIIITASTLANSYTYYISTTTNIVNAIFTSTTSTTGSSVAFSLALSGSTTYYVIVVPINSYGPGPQFTSNFILPSGGSVTTSTLTPTGGNITIVASLDVVSYNYYISTTTSTANAIYSSTTTTTGSAIAFSATLIGSTSYYVIVVPVNTYGVGAQFTYNFIIPAGGSTVISSATTAGGNITITPSTNATSYNYYISPDTTIGNAIFTSTTSTTGSAVAFTQALTAGTSYYAIVVPVNSYGKGLQFTFNFILPSGGSTVISSATTTGCNITIAASANTTSYNYYISTTTNTVLAIFSSTTSTTGSAIAITQALTPGTSYYAIVVPVNAYGSGPQFTYNFILPSGGSVATSTLTPANGYITITASSYATSYNYYISPNTTIASAIYSNTTTTTGSAIAFTQATTPGTNYYVIVVPINSYGSGLQFTYNFILPVADTATITALTTIGGNITITASAYATSYNYYISTDTTTANAIFTSNTTTTGSAVAFSQAITPGITYYALVIPIDSYGSGPQFTLSFILPSGGSVAPPNLTTTGGNLTITPSTGATSYTYYISTTTSQANSVYSNTTVITGSAVSFSTTLQGSTTYYALVVPTNTNGLGAQFNSSGVSFTLPSGGSAVISSATTAGGNITITASTLANSYNYYISTTTSTANSIFSSSTSTTGSAVAFTQALIVGTSYYAIVIPINSYGPGPQFTFNFILPSGGSVSTSTLTLAGGNITIVASTNATSYNYYVSTTTSISNAIYSSTTSTTGSAIAFSTTLTGSTTYYVIVVAVNAFGSGTQFTSTFILPAGGSAVISSAKTTGGNITISASTNATSYSYYISTDTTIASAIFTSTTSTTGSAVAFTQALTPGTSYYAIVVPTNTYGVGAQFIFNFIIPSGGSVSTSTLTPTGGNITIVASTNATSYSYYISTTTSTANSIFTNSTSTTGSAVAFSTALTGSTTYYVIVIPVNTYGSGPQFTSTFILPSGGSVATSTLTPIGGNITITTSTNATSYNYYISTTTSTANAIYSNTTTTTGSAIAFTQALTPGTSYYVIVVPVNTYGVGAQFTYNFILPAGGSAAITSATTAGGNITITSSTNATSYNYYISTDTTIGNAIYSNTTSTTGSAVAFTQALTPGTSYYAIVVPVNSYGIGLQFTSNFILPSGGSVSTSTLTPTGGNITIVASTSATSYNYYISTTTSTANSIFTSSTSTTGSAVAFSTALTGSTTYYVIVIPVNTYGSGPQFTATFILPSGGSVALSSLTTGSGNITITASTGATSYNYYISTTTSTANAIYSNTTTTTGSAVAFTQALTPGTNYYIIVVPVNTYGVGAQFTVNFIIPSGGSAALSGLSATGGNITITASTGATSYTYYISIDTTIGNAIYTNTTTTTGSAVAFLISLTASTLYYAVVVPSNTYISGAQFVSSGSSYSTILYSFSAFTFTNAGATLQNGPTLLQCTTAYSGTSWTSNTAYFNMTTQGYQLWTVPNTQAYTVICAGAATNNPSNGSGYGAIIITSVSLTRSQQIQILVGQMGQLYSGYSSGGGGGSFVASGTTPATGTCLVAAGGGGGFNYVIDAALSTQNASFTTSGNNAGDGTLGGTAGGGGAGPYYYTQGGAGFIGNGANPQNYGGTVALSFQNGGTGGSSGTSYVGGFGGGGGLYSSTGGGGGGGYSGGGGAYGERGGGGGSFPTTATSVGLNTSQGYVTIYPTTYSAVPTGGSVTLSAFSTTGVTLTIGAATNALIYTYYITTSGSSIATYLYSGTTTLTATAIVITIPLTPGTTYYGAIVAFNNIGSASTVFSSAYNFPGLVPIVTLSALTSTGGTLTWTAAALATGYNWYVGTGFGTGTLTSGSTSALTINFTSSLTNNTYYYAWVTATTPIATGILTYAIAIYYTTATGTLYTYTTNTFTNAGATLQNGPTLLQCTTAYSGTTWASNTLYFNMTTQGYQLWTVPITQAYTIVCAGAATNFPSNGSGYGAIIATTFNLTIGQKIQILVGQMGQLYSGYSSGGGGGSFVASGLTPAAGTCIVAAGGGGGFNYVSDAALSTQNASLTTSGNNGADGTLGGTLGGGGAAPLNYTEGGAGFIGNGAYPLNTGGTVALSFQNGGTGGSSSSGYVGGFGGGGGLYSSTGGGGGGGYSGGGGAYNNRGGGGGSFPTTATSLGLNNSQGFVAIYPTTYSAVPTGGTVTLSAFSTTGVTLTIGAATNALIYTYYITTSGSSIATYLYSGITTLITINVSVALTPGTTYYGAIVATNIQGSGSTVFSSAYSFPGLIATVTLSALTSTGGTLTWTAAALATGYNWVVGTGYGTGTLTSGSTTALTINFTSSLTNNTYYYAWVIPTTTITGTRTYGIGYYTTATGTLYTYTTNTFTNAGATLQNGPTLLQCTTAYSGTTWASNTLYFNMTTQGYQLWTVPITQTYTIVCAGAATNNPSNGSGYGAIIATTFNLTIGQKIQILVGQMGQLFTNASSGGGGGSFVAAGLTPAAGVCIVAAGGGGGFTSVNGSALSTQNASFTTSGNNAEDGTLGGTAGGGGAAPSTYTQGGAGFIGNGANPQANGGTVALSFQNGGTGGITGTGYVGGFGGGGGIWSTTGGGGGGGYSGGGGAYYNRGGGGGSFPTTATSLGLNKSQGFVAIYPTTYSAVPTGGTVTLSAFSTTGVTLTIGAATNALIYTYYITTSGSSIATYLYSGTTSLTTINVSIVLTPGTTYYGAIVATNIQGSGSTIFSSACIFPGLIATVTLSALISTGGTITWTASTLATGYNWYVGTGYGTGVVTSGSTNALTINFTSSLTNNTYYYAWVIPTTLSTGIPSYAIAIYYTTATGTLYTYTTNTFTNAAATSQNGPTLSQCTTAYSGTTWASNTAYFNMTTQGYQLWTVPITQAYTIVCAGAGTSFGNGVIIVITVNLTIGQKIQILVGQQGIRYTTGSSGGCGGSFVASGLTPVAGTCIVAAGGGGGTENTISSGGVANATTSTSGNASNTGSSGGSAGLGGSGSSSGWGGGGGGFTGNGTDSSGISGSAGLSFINGGIGGATATSAVGGFGGGGGTHGNTGGGGGGGGYSGGGGSTQTGNGLGGGGGSFPTSAISIGLNNSQGYVIIYPTTYVSVPTGGTISISSVTTTGATLTIGAATNALIYTYYIVTSGTIVSPIYSATSLTATAIVITTSLPTGTTYYGAMVPSNNIGSGSTVFSSVFPTGGSVVISTLTTTGGSITITASANATSYTYYINTSVSTVSPIYTTTTTTTGSAVAFTATFVIGTTYYAIVVPTNAIGAGTQFSSAGFPLGLPSGGSVVISTLITTGGSITITASTNATSYTYYINTTVSTVSPTYTSTTTTTGSAVAFTATFVGGTTYYAIVVPTNANGSGTQFSSTGFTFVLPTGGSVVISTLTTAGGSITITASTNATSYTYYINTSVSTVSPTYTSTTTTTGSAVSFTATFVQGTTYYAIVVPTNANGSGTRFSSAGFAATSSGLYTFTGTLTFTPAGATGANGPTLSQCTTTYSSFGAWVSNTAYFNMTTAGYQLWTVPSTRVYTFVVAGARGGGGGTANYGRGGIATVNFSLTQGHVIKMVIGQMGIGSAGGCGAAPYDHGGGGGGTYIYNNNTSTLLIAIGGGGGGGSEYIQSSMDAIISSTSGNSGQSNGGGGGVSGNGGAAGTTGCVGGGGGGGGYSSNGAGNSGNGGASFLTTSIGGVATGYGADGGFGGGGGGGTYTGNGGGGYSGGGGGSLSACSCSNLGGGGGGGSYSSVTLTSSSVTNTGNGYVSIT